MLKKSYLFQSAAFAFLIALVSIIPILFLNEGRLFLVGDYMTQQIPFMKECRRVILSGTPFWSANTFLGANFIGTYSFYVYGSPFFWPLLLIPERFMTYALGILLVLKHTVAAVTANLYLSKHTANKNYALAGSLMYAFSGFAIDSSFYYHFLDVIALFPLVLYFTDRVLEGKGTARMSAAVFVCAITNYYFFISTSFIFLFYLFFRIRYSDGKYGIKDGVRCVASYGIGGLAAAVILIPSALCLLETSKATNSYSAGIASVFSTFPQYIKFIEALVLPGEGILDSGTGFSYFTYTSTAAFLPLFGAVFYLISLKRNENDWAHKLLRFFTFLTIIPLGNGMFSLFTNMSYTRWWYGFVLIMILVSFKVLEGMESGPSANDEFRKSIKTVFVLASAVTLLPLAIKCIAAYGIADRLENLLPETVTKYFVSSGFTKPLDATDWRYFAVLVVLAAVSYIPLCVMMKNGRIFTRKIVPAVAVICVMTYGVYLTSEYVTYFERSPSTYSEEADFSLSETTEYTSRVQNNKTLANYAMISNEPAVSTFHSFKSHATAEFARIVGYDVGPMPDTKVHYSTPAIQTVLSIETVVSADSSRSVAPYYTPMGYVYDYYVEDSFSFTRNAEENNRRIELMTKACVLDTETAAKLSRVVRPLGSTAVDWKAACSEKRKTACTDFVMNTSGFTCKSTGDGERLVYFSVPYDSGWRAYINGEEAEIFTVNGGMMGIVVPNGVAEIEFEFLPPGLIAGAAVSAISMLAIVAEALWEKKKSNKK